MSYRLKKSESVPHGIKRVAMEQIESAIEQLARGKDRVEAIHEARKSIKRIRGALRLVQCELGATYHLENARLRDVGRGLSSIRDAAAMIEVFDWLIEKHGVDFAQIRRALEKSKQQAEQSPGGTQVVSDAIAGLRAIGRRAEDWPLRADGFGAIAPGMASTYRRGRKALKKAQQNGSPELFHGLRKRVKEQWYQVRLLEGVWTPALEARERDLKRVETWLGDDHNLTLLQGELGRESGGYGVLEDVEHFLTLSMREQTELRTNAISRSQLLYEEKPKVFVEYIGKIWDEEGAKKRPGRTPGKTKSAVA
ncbi:MAG TPA: CHAD domain-containing protein [Bryobacteraceae bacterium]|jgi:CHAD domain-containing protein